MKIGIYGCSWTCGSKGNDDSTNYVSWAKELAKSNPQWEIHNYARGGIGMDAISYFYEKTSHLHDLNIVKFTGLERKTWLHPDLHVEIESKLYNYFTWAGDANKMMYTFSLGGFKSHYLSNAFNFNLLKKAYKAHMIYFNLDYEYKKSIMIAKYLQSQADITFCHLKTHENLYNVPSTETFIDNFKSYVYDSGNHINEQGSIIEASWVKKNILDKFF